MSPRSGARAIRPTAATTCDVHRSTPHWCADAAIGPRSLAHGCIHCASRIAETVCERRIATPHWCADAPDAELPSFYQHPANHRGGFRAIRHGRRGRSSPPTTILHAAENETFTVAGAEPKRCPGRYVAGASLTLCHQPCLILGRLQYNLYPPALPALPCRLEAPANAGQAGKPDLLILAFGRVSATRPPSRPAARTQARAARAIMEDVPCPVSRSISAAVRSWASAMA